MAKGLPYNSSETYLFVSLYYILVKDLKYI